MKLWKIWHQYNPWKFSQILTFIFLRRCILPNFSWKCRYFQYICSQGEVRTLSQNIAQKQKINHNISVLGAGPRRSPGAPPPLTRCSGPNNRLFRDGAAARSLRRRPSIFTADTRRRQIHNLVEATGRFYTERDETRMSRRTERRRSPPRPALAAVRPGVGELFDERIIEYICI